MPCRTANPSIKAGISTWGLEVVAAIPTVAGLFGIPAEMNGRPDALSCAGPFSVKHREYNRRPAGLQPRVW
jgi:hypothetical protein